MKNKTLDEQELNRLMNTYGTEVLRLCYLYLKNYSLAEDACQDTFLKVYKNFHKFQGNSSEKTWITRICINTCKNYLRSSWIKKVVLDYKLDYKKVSKSLISHEEMFSKIEDDDLIGLIMDLKAKYKEVILMYYYQELTVKEMSEILRISESNVYTRLSRARNSLKNKCMGGAIYERY